MPKLKVISDQARRQGWMVPVMGKLQRVSERYFLIGLAIALRKKLEGYAISDEVDVDTDVHGRVGSRSRPHNLVLNHINYET